MKIKALLPWILLITVLLLAAVALGHYAKHRLQQAVSAAFQRLTRPVNKDGLSATVLECLTNGDRVEILSLDPDRKTGRGKKAFHGWAVLGTCKLESQDVHRLRDRLSLAVRTATTLDVVNCFVPRHGIRASKSGTVAELVISFECGRLEEYVNGSQKRNLYISHMPIRFCNALLRASHVPVSMQHD